MVEGRCELPSTCTTMGQEVLLCRPNSASVKRDRIDGPESNFALRYLEVGSTTVKEPTQRPCIERVFHRSHGKLFFSFYT